MSTIDYSQEVIRIFEQANLLPESRQRAFIEEQCRGNPECLRHCIRLLEHACSDAEFFEEFANPRDIDNIESSLIGKTFGNYRLIKKIGSGGMADVYAATRVDGIHDRLVALKLVRGWGRLDELLQRFHRERQILASLKHPNIAHFLDGGVSEDGRPYYVMEMVEGEHIDSYCRQHNLSVNDRLKLFLQVCSAVASAHQQLVVHRDLKPENILVTPEKNVKLLDFGIAKILEESVEQGTHLSNYGTPMTPRFSSPEQLKRERLTTASDQYSLGVLLHEILSGGSPYDLENSHPITEAFKEKHRSPSQTVLKNNPENKKLVRELAGDIDAIVMKAMRLEPENRYVSVQQLAEDIQRYLNTKPVHARKINRPYVIRKFLQRNATVIALTSVMLVLIVFVATVQQIRIIQERNMAQQERDVALQSRKFMVSLFDTFNPDEKNANNITAREILDRGVKNIDQGFNIQPETKGALLHTIGTAYRKLGLYKEAAPLLREALELRQSNSGISYNDLADSLNELGTLLANQGKFLEAKQYLQMALKHYSLPSNPQYPGMVKSYVNLGYTEWVSGGYHTAIEYYDQALTLGLEYLDNEDPLIADANKGLGVIYRHFGEYEKAIEYNKKALDLRLKLQRNHPDIAELYNDLGFSFWHLQRYENAIDYYEKAKRITENAYGNEHPSLADTYTGLGLVYWHKGNYDEAISYFEAALPIKLKVLGPKHAGVSDTYTNLGFVYLQKGDFDKALEHFEIALPIRIGALGIHHPTVSDTYTGMGLVYSSKGKYDRAIEYYNAGLEIVEKELGNTHPKVGDAYTNLGFAYWNKGEYDNAIDYFERSLPIKIKAYGLNHTSVTDSYTGLGLAYWSKGLFHNSIENHTKALRIRIEKLGEVHPNVADSLSNLGLAQRSIGENELALQHYSKALDISIKNFGELHPSVANIYKNYGNIFAENNELDQAVTYFNKALDIYIEILDGEENSTVAIVYTDLGKTYSLKNETDKAVKYLNAALAILSRTVGEEHPLNADVHIVLGDIYFSNDQLEKAESHLKKALSIRETKIGANHKHTQEALKRLSEIKYQLTKSSR